MRKRFLFAAPASAAAAPPRAPARARPPAQQPRPATPPAQQPRPAATPARPAMSTGTAQRAGALEIDVQPATIRLRDEALWAAAIGGTANTMSLGAVLRGG